jgi:hypothetical protein
MNQKIDVKIKFWKLYERHDCTKSISNKFSSFISESIYIWFNIFSTTFYLSIYCKKLESGAKFPYIKKSSKWFPWHCINIRRNNNDWLYFMVILENQMTAKKKQAFINIEKHCIDKILLSTSS